MRRTTLSLSASVLLAVAAQAQCLTSPAVGPLSLVQWSSASGYSSTFVVQDEGLTNTPIDLTPAFGPAGFPMAGAVGTLNQMWVNTNGEVYLTDSALGLTQPVGGALYGVNTIAEARGGAAGSARIFAFGADISASAVAGAAWAITADVNPGSVKVTWTDVARLGSTGTDRFSFSTELQAGGSVAFSYSPTFPVMTSWCGLSIGNDVGTTASPSRSLRGGPVGSDSGTEGLLYQSTTFDLANFSILITPNGTGGYLANVLCEPASNVDFGAGCHSYQGVDDSNCVELFAGSPAAKAALDNNAMLFNVAGAGYVATWLPAVATALYVPPTGAATILALTDDSVTNITPSVAVPVPGGTAPVWTISSNGILTAAATGNQTTSTGGTLASIGTGPSLGWYCWRDYNPAAAGSGKVKTEEVGSMFYVTFDGVYEYNTSNPATFQYQINTSTGDVTIVWVSMAVSVNTTNLITGCSLAGTGPTPVSSTLSNPGVFVLTPQVVLTPMTLSAAPAPVINPSTVVTYTANNLPEYAPGSGIYLSTCFLSVVPNPAGFDLSFIGLTTVPGCNAYIGSLDLDLGAQLTFANTASWNVTYSNLFFTPGNHIGAQAVALFDASVPLPNGESGGLLMSNGVLSTTQLN